MKIAFHDNSLCLRGTTVAIYDWAYWTRHYINVEPIIMFNLNNDFNDKSVIEKFEKEFPVFGYENKGQIDDILSKNNCDAFLMEKGGEPDGIISTVSKNLVNAISGWWKPGWIHGDVYAMGSKWLSKLTDYKIPYVPYIVHLPEHNLNMRDELGIPNNALVFGRNGGWDTFDIPFVKQSIVECLGKRKDIWFVFQYTEPFFNHERIIYLPPTADLNEKVKFINTSDVMLHARYIGESFGLSCAEFSIRNKPVITYYNSPERNHIFMLKEKGLYYTDENNLFDILLNFRPNSGKNWNAYGSCTPEIVMQKFNDVFIKKI